jgi:dihydropteroate synthase
MLGTPQTMQTNPTYENVVEQIYAYLAGRIDFCVRAGITPEKIIIDPGIGFGKTVDHNIILIKNLSRFKSLGCRILMGVSRKSFIAKLYTTQANQKIKNGHLNSSSTMFTFHFFIQHQYKQNIIMATYPNKT